MAADEQLADRGREQHLRDDDGQPHTVLELVHYGATNQQYWFAHDEDGTQWHTMAMEWEPDAIRIYRDGVHVWTVTDAAAIPDVAHHVVMQLDAIKPTMAGVVRYQVDWMRIYERVA